MRIQKNRNFELLKKAVLNNAAWCDAVCRSHGIPSEMIDSLWIARAKTPPFYPNAVTLTNDNEEGQIKEIESLMKMGIKGEIGIKDSFAALDLSSLGFTILFESEWIFRPGDAPRLTAQGAVEWKKIDTSLLAQWEEAWASTTPGMPKIFLPQLLDNKDIAFFGGFQNGKIVAGCIANKTRDVVGLSNIFTPENNAHDFWVGLLSMITHAFPNSTIVGYESGDTLRIAEDLGFATLGTLRVWVKN